jgi:hypothetical protein
MQGNRDTDPRMKPLCPTRTNTHTRTHARADPGLRLDYQRTVCDATLGAQIPLHVLFELFPAVAATAIP